MDNSPDEIEYEGGKKLKIKNRDKFPEIVERLCEIIKQFPELSEEKWIKLLRKKTNNLIKAHIHYNVTYIAKENITFKDGKKAFFLTETDTSIYWIFNLPESFDRLRIAIEKHNWKLMHGKYEEILDALNIIYTGGDLSEIVFDNISLFDEEEAGGSGDLYWADGSPLNSDEQMNYDNMDYESDAILEIMLTFTTEKPHCFDIVYNDGSVERFKDKKHFLNRVHEVCKK
jgi:hypothetical protein